MLEPEQAELPVLIQMKVLDALYQFAGSREASSYWFGDLEATDVEIWGLNEWLAITRKHAVPAASHERIPESYQRPLGSSILDEVQQVISSLQRMRDEVYEPTRPPSGRRVEELRVGMYKQGTPIEVLGKFAPRFGREAHCAVMVDALEWAECHRAVRKGAYDLLSIDSPWLHGLHNAGLISELDPFIPESCEKTQPLREAVVKEALQECIIEGVFWAVPIILNVQMLYYRQDLFEAAGVRCPPATFHELLRAVGEIDREEERVRGLALRYESPNPVVTDFLAFAIAHNVVLPGPVSPSE